MKSPYTYFEVPLQHSSGEKEFAALRSLGYLNGLAPEQVTGLGLS